METFKKAVVLLSGGLDSSTCLALAVQGLGNKNVIALNMYYGQKHDKEIQSARAVAKHYNTEYIEMDVSETMIYSDCSLLKSSKKEIAHKSYQEQLNERENGQPVATYVPFRNGLFLSLAAAVALCKDADVIVFGAHKDDAAGNAYPDSSVSFAKAIDHAIYEGTGQKVRVYAPFIEKNKADIVKEGLRLKVPYGLTWSCYEGGEVPCGTCGTCIDRRQAFEANNAQDPINEEE